MNGLHVGAVPKQPNLTWNVPSSHTVLWGSELNIYSMGQKLPTVDISQEQVRYLPSARPLPPRCWAFWLVLPHKKFRSPREQGDTKGSSHLHILSLKENRSPSPNSGNSDFASYLTISSFFISWTSPGSPDWYYSIEAALRVFTWGKQNANLR